MEDDPFFAPYDDSFWMENGSEAHRAAEQRMARELYSVVGAPKIIVDVGCGTGQMLHALFKQGAYFVRGYESEQGIAACRRLGILELEDTQLVPWDLRKPDPPYDLARPPDLVVCVEVLEHLPEEAAKRVVEWICRRLNPEFIALSGARPGSVGGTGHINEQQPLYWMNLVHSFGTHWFDAMLSDELHRRTIGTFSWSELVNVYRRL
jgi:SAM-dependent methyltransferase